MENAMSRVTIVGSGFAALAAARRMRRLAAGLVMILAFGAAGLWLASGMDGFRITAMPDPGALPNPLAKSVEMVNGAWLTNYSTIPG